MYARVCALVSDVAARLGRRGHGLLRGAAAWEGHWAGPHSQHRHGLATSRGRLGLAPRCRQDDNPFRPHPTPAPEPGSFLADCTP
eukprot:364224-Chlamydomonas_euryale.AAC.5